MTSTLAGKWVWLWNWRRCDAGDAARVASRLRAAGCAGALLKSFDGPRWFEQGRPWREIARELRAAGVAVGGWGYLYGQDPAGEAQMAIETAQYGEADLLVLDVESEFKGRGQAAEEVCRRIRQALGPDYPLYFSSFAIARYHQSFPFQVFARHCTGAVPQVYWNAFRWPVERALAWTYEDYAALGMRPEQLFPAGGLYQEGSVTYPDQREPAEFARLARERGSAGVSFWSYEHMSDAMWEAAAAAHTGRRDGPEGEQEVEMSSREFEELSAAVSQLRNRVARVEEEVRSLVAGAPAAQRGYTVQPGDTLSGIARKLGLAGWQRLYEVNTGVIGPDPNRIYPGQVLRVP